MWKQICSEMIVVLLTTSLLVGLAATIGIPVGRQTSVEAVGIGSSAQPAIGDSIRSGGF
jgi:hypothetical protein